MHVLTRGGAQLPRTAVDKQPFIVTRGNVQCPTPLLSVQFASLNKNAFVEGDINCTECFYKVTFNDAHHVAEAPQTDMHNTSA